MKQLFGPMSMFYSVLGSSGSSPTPPINYIGATPQLNFATILGTGGFMGNSPATGTVLADGVSYDGAAWTAKDTGAVALQMNGALPGIVLYANSGLTPGVAYGPTAAVTWLGPGNPWTFTDKLDVASLPAADATNAGILTASGVQDIGGTNKNFAGLIRAQGSTAPASGIGTEVGHDGTTGTVASRDRGGAVYKAHILDGLSVALRPNGTAMVTATTGGITFAGSISNKVTTVTGAGPTTLSASDSVVNWKPTVTAAGQINLNSAPGNGLTVYIVDAKGIAATNTLTISGNGKTINGAASITITTNYGGVLLIYNGTEWNIIANF